MFSNFNDIIVFACILVSYVLAKTAKDLEQSIKSTTTITESAKLGQESKSTHTGTVYIK